MTKRILFILLALVLVFSVGLIGCMGEEEEEEEEEEPIEAIDLIFSDHNPPGNAMAEALDEYADYIEAASDGKINIAVKHMGEGIPEDEVFTALQVSSPAADAANYVPEMGDGIEYLNVIALPFMGWQAGQTGQNMAMDVYNTLIADIPEILGQFPSTLSFTACYVMPGGQLNFYAEGLSITTPAQLNGLTLAAMEETVKGILEEIPGVSVDVLGFDEVLTGVPVGIDDGFVQHLEFCAFFNLIQYLHSHTLFDGGIYQMPIGILWNKASYDACVAKLTEVGADATAVMAGANQEYISTGMWGTAADTSLAFTQLTTLPGQSYVTLNAAQIEANGWPAAVEGYVTEWKNSCDSATKAQEILDAAKAAIAAWTPPGPPGP